MRIASIIGATGLIGTKLQQLLLLDNYYDVIRILVRWPLEQPHEKIEVKLVDFTDAESLMLALEGSDVIFCAIGTTMKNVKGDKMLYTSIDHDIPIRTCKLAMERGCKKFVIVSSVGANSKSNHFYLQLKGQTEKDLAGTGIEALHIMQPGFLLGDRKEKRSLEKLAQAVIKPISGLLTGKAKKYKAIHADDIARAMIAGAKKNKQGIFRYTYTEIMNLATN